MKIRKLGKKGFALMESMVVLALAVAFCAAGSIHAQAQAFADIKANGSDGSVSIAYNTSASLNWISTQTTSCSLNGSPVAIWGSQATGNLTASQTYNLSCTGAGGNVSDAVIVNVNPPPTPTADIKANGSDGSVSIAYNTSASLNWISTQTTSCSLNGSPVAIWGSQTTGNLTASQTYNLSCTGPGGSAADSVVVNVSAPPTPAGIAASVAPATITRGQTSIVAALVKDQYGAAMSNVSVSFSLNGLGSINPSQAVTDSSGRASTTYSSPGHFADQSIQATITACAGSSVCSSSTVTVNKK